MPYVNPLLSGLPQAQVLGSAQAPAFSGYGGQSPYAPAVRPGMGEVPCQEGYVLDTDTNTCVPIDVALDEARSSDRPDRFVGGMPTVDGGYISFRDMFDGGGPGRAGDQFEGLPYVSDALNQYGGQFGLVPLGSKERAADRAVVEQATADIAAGKSITEEQMAAVNRVADHDRKSDNDRESGAERIQREARERATGGGKGSIHKSGAIKKTSGKRDKGSASTYGITKEHMGGGSSNKNVGPAGKRDTGNKSLYGLNKGGLVAYKQEGGILPGAVPPAPQPLPGAVPPMPQGPEMAPEMPPMAPPAPVGPPPRKSFTERVMEAKELIKSGATPLPSAPLPQQGMMDAQGDGPVMIHPEAGMPSPAMVGPDMGPDTFDAELEEGSMVMNPEASMMYEEELMGYFNGGMVNAKSSY